MNKWNLIAAEDIRIPCGDKWVRVLKTRWYVCVRYPPPDFPRGVRGSFYALLGPFRTESKAFGSMFRRAARQNPAYPSQILMERKPEYEGFVFYTVRGSRILDFPNVHLPEEWACPPK